jgi:exonuclease III
MREKKCGWRIDVFYANESLMEDVLSSEILDNVFSPCQMQTYRRLWAQTIARSR